MVPGVLQVRPSLELGLELEGRHEGAAVQQVKDLSGELTVHPGSYGSGRGSNSRATGRPKPPGKESEKVGLQPDGPQRE